jgi:pyridoxal biosynthesis lyase PdxS
MPVFVTFRFTDILRGLVAQPIMAAHGYQLGFIGATVIQKRNPHDYMKDFISEIPVYEHSRRVIEIVSEVVSPIQTIKCNLLAAYGELYRKGIVLEKELAALDAWLSDLEKISSPTS